MTEVLRFMWVSLFVFFVIGGYKAAFERPEWYAEQWEDATAFTFLLLVIVSAMLYVTSGPKGKHD